jgi:hypothetical protein
MKSRKSNICPMCGCDRTHILSDALAVKLYVFLQTISANFQCRYQPRIERHYALKVNRNINEQTPWRRKANPH